MVAGQVGHTSSIDLPAVGVFRQTPSREGKALFQTFQALDRTVVLSGSFEVRNDVIDVGRERCRQLDGDVAKQTIDEISADDDLDNDDRCHQNQN